MRVGDLVKFSKGAGWLKELEGQVGVVVAIRHAPARSDGRWHEWDCLVGGVLQESLYVRLDDPGYLEPYGVKILSKVCNP